MAGLEELNLNRFLYKDNSNLSPSDVDSSISIQQPQNIQSGSSGGPETPSTPQIPANAVAPGTVIQACLLQSSGGTNRVEIDPRDNSLTVYDNTGRIIVKIDVNGVFSEYYEGATAFIDSAFVQDLTADTVSVSDFIGTNDLFVSGVTFYGGATQPVLYNGQVDGTAGSFVYGPSGWTVTKNGTGDYTITHNLGALIYTTFMAPLNGHYRYQVLNITADTFDVSWQQSAYAAGLYTGEVPVDVDFMMNLQNII